MELRVGLVGLAQARQFIDIFNSHPGFEVTALCDIDERMLDEVGDAAGISQRFTDFDRFIESDLDVVEFSTPIQVHGAYAIKALERGKHVLCQYIAANDPAEGERLLRACEDSGKKYMYIETDLYVRNNQVMMALARKGVLGELVTGWGDYMHDCSHLAYKPDGGLTWRGEMWQWMRGGVVMGVHASMPLLKLFGERAQRIFAKGSGAHTLSPLVANDFFVGLADLPSGRMLEFRHSWAAHRWYRIGFALQGTKGCFEYDGAAIAKDGSHVKGWQTLAELEAEYGLEGLITDDRGHHSAFNQCVDDFIRSIANDTRPPLDIYDALHCTAIGWAAEESMRTGKPVDVIQYD